MAKVRFFAQARDASGCRDADIDAKTLGELLEELVVRFGAPLGAVIETSTVWLNGDVVAPDHPVGDADEVAILPPVSGG